MLLMSSTVPIFDRYICGSRRGARYGNAGAFSDPSVAIKPWHMACVGGSGFYRWGIAVTTRGGGGARLRELKFANTAANFLTRGALARGALERARLVSTEVAASAIEVSNAIG
jgi:hypothetical protein